MQAQDRQQELQSETVCREEGREWELCGEEMGMGREGRGRTGYAKKVTYNPYSGLCRATVLTCISLYIVLSHLVSGRQFVQSNKHIFKKSTLLFLETFLSQEDVSVEKVKPGVQ